MKKSTYCERLKKYTDEYCRANYKSYTLRVPKDYEASIKARAEALGLSVNSYFKKLIDDDLMGNKRSAQEEAKIKRSST